MKLVGGLPLLVLWATAHAHPEISAEERKEFLEFAAKYKHFDDNSAVEYRSQELNKLKRGSKKNSRVENQRPPKMPNFDPKDGERFATIDHHSGRTDVAPGMRLEDLFTNGTTLLQPESTEGPFYVGGEFIRDDISEDQSGIPLWISANFYDITSGEPVEGMYWEVWHCNATGFYSGVDAPMNSKENLLDETFLRGLKKTDKNGAATVKTVFPGHYDGRAVHIHMAAHVGAVEFSNGTLGIGLDSQNGNIAHVGQMFFDDKLIDTVEQAWPYNANEAALKRNADDFILAGLSHGDVPDPFMNYVFLGDDIEDGIFAWISIGIDASASYKPRLAAYYTEEGGVSVPHSGPPGGPHKGPGRAPHDDEKLDTDKPRGEKKPHDDKPHNENPHEKKPHDKKPHDKKPHDQKPHDQKPHSSRNGGNGKHHDNAGSEPQRPNGRVYDAFAKVISLIF